MKSPITINFAEGEIILNAAFAKKASNPFSKEYGHLQKVREDFPEFTVLIKEIKKKEGKESYKGLTYDYMRAYIMSHEQGENRINAIMEFDEMLLISQCHSKGRRYPVIKNWFLENYPFTLKEQIQMLPGVDAWDGFFIAKLERKRND